MPEAIVVERAETDRDALLDLLEKEGFRTRAFSDLASCRDALEERSPDLALVAVDLPDGSGTELIEELDEGEGVTEVIFIASNASVETAIEALRGGAIDYLRKPVDTHRLRHLLRRIQRALQLRSQVASLRSELKSMGRFGPLVGASASMRAVFDKIERVAATSATVIVVGETGVGKELVARAIHETSSRSSRPFVAINCGALPATLVESELFGNEKGAFTGADGRRAGVFERADGGTLFLDEITEMPPELQVRLLRTLELREITRVGGSEVVEVDVRIVAATNADPMRAVDEGRLRQDLLHRLLVFPIVVPPLRQRAEDVELLAKHFLSELNERSESAKILSADALEGLRRQQWPGNVRQLKNAIERGYILADEEIRAEHLVAQDALLEAGPPQEKLPLDVGMSLAQAERRLIEATLAEYGNDKKRAARTLGISLRTLYNRLRTYRDV